MKLNFLYIITLFVLSYIFVSVQQSSNGEFSTFHSTKVTKNTGGSPVAKTGAPGEGTCVQCHAGSVMAGANQNILKVLDGGNEVTAYMPGVTYQVSLSLATGNVKEGFGSTALLTNNTAAGSVPNTGMIGTKVSTSGGRNYITHKSGSSNEGNISWDWDWIAPSTESGPVTFYVASNKANGNNLSSGDQIFVSQHVIQSVLGVEDETADEFQFNAGYSSSTNALTIQYAALTIENAFMSLVDLSGKTVFSRQLGNSKIGANKNTIPLNEYLKHGTYIVQFFLGNSAKTKKVII